VNYSNILWCRIRMRFSAEERSAGRMGERGPSNLIVWAVSRLPYASPATVAIFAMRVQRWRPSRPSIISRGADDARRSSSQSRTSSAASKISSWTLNPLLRGACCSASTATPRGPSVLGSRARRVPPGRRTTVWCSCVCPPGDRRCPCAALRRRRPRPPFPLSGR
jgi:hypothetical protein